MAPLDPIALVFICQGNQAGEARVTHEACIIKRWETVSGVAMFVSLLRERRHATKAVLTPKWCGLCFPIKIPRFGILSTEH